MQPGFDPHSTGPDRGGPTSPGAVVYNSQYTGILKSALERARAGILAADWRRHLPEPTGIFTTSERFRDANTMVAQALNDMALQPWEPGQASNWRVALDSWFAAARHTLACEYTAFAQTQLRTLMDGERALSTLTSHIGIPGSVLDAAQRPWNLIAGDVITTGDRVLRERMATYVIQRDWLTASYLAGLTAGGTPVLDWRGWITTRACDWTDTSAQLLQRVDTETRVPRGQHPIETLPHYWCRTPPPGHR